MSVRDSKKVYISNIPRGCRERDLGRLFEELGRILLLDFKNKFAFIEYERSSAASDAIHKFDGIEFMGRRLRVEPYCYRGGDRKYRPDQEAHDFRIVVTGLDSFTSWQDLKDFGRTAGRSVTFADIREIEDRHGHRISEGVIEYANNSDYEISLTKLDGARLNGARVQVRAVEQDDSYDRKRFKEDGGYRNRGFRRRSRSHSRGYRGNYRGDKYKNERHRRSRSRSERKYDVKGDDGRERKHRRRRSESSGKRSPKQSKERERERSRSPRRRKSRSGSRVSVKHESSRSLSH